MTTHTPAKQYTGGAAICRLALIGGALVSVSANVAHAESTMGARLLSAVFPLFLIAAVEILVRVPWRAARGFTTIGFLLTLTVALGAAYVSYAHLAGLALKYGEPWGVAHTLPIAVDGFSTLGALGLLAIEKYQRASVTTEPVPVPVVPVTKPIPVYEPEATIHYVPVPPVSTEVEPTPVPVLPVPDIEPVPSTTPETSTKDGDEEKRPVPHAVLTAELLARYSEAGDKLTTAKLIDEMKLRTGKGVSQTKACALLKEARTAVA